MVRRVVEPEDVVEHGEGGREVCDPVGVLALLHDVHGNLGALEAVLADARQRGATGHLIGGDVALFGARPARPWRD